MESEKIDGRSKTSALQVTRHKAKELNDLSTQEALRTVRNMPEDISDRDVLILMLAVHCSPEAVALSLEPQAQGQEVRQVIASYREYFDELKLSADKVLRCLLEDSMMITLARIRTGLMTVKVNTASAVRSFMSTYVMMREIWASMPPSQDRTPEQGINRLEELQSKLDGMALKDKKESKEQSCPSERSN